jgi:inorganic phosphate transporter, PiT family
LSTNIGFCHITSPCQSLALVCGLNQYTLAVLSARRVAETMSKKITPMNHGQGFTANLTTSLLVVIASRFGLPVSTTHVSCGALFGLGAVTGQMRWKVATSIVLAWLITLPVAATLAGIFAWGWT